MSCCNINEKKINEKKRGFSLGLGLEVGENRSRSWEQKWVSKMEQKRISEKGSEKVGGKVGENFEKFENFEKLAENAVRASLEGISYSSPLGEGMLQVSKMERVGLEDGNGG